MANVPTAIQSGATILHPRLRFSCRASQSGIRHFWGGWKGP
jgi:hypothetical protein